MKIWGPCSSMRGWRPRSLMGDRLKTLLFDRGQKLNLTPKQRSEYFALQQKDKEKQSYSLMKLKENKKEKVYIKERKNIWKKIISDIHNTTLALTNRKIQDDKENIHSTTTPSFQWMMLQKESCWLWMIPLGQAYRDARCPPQERVS